MKGIPEKLVLLEVRQAHWRWVSRSPVGPEAGVGWCIRDPGAGYLKLLVRAWGQGQAEAERAEPGGEVKQIPGDWQGPRVIGWGCCGDSELCSLGKQEDWRHKSEDRNQRCGGHGSWSPGPGFKT